MWLISEIISSVGMIPLQEVSFPMKCICKNSNLSKLKTGLRRNFKAWL